MEPEQIVLSSLWRLEAGLAIFFTLVYETSGDHPACSRNLTHSLPDFDASHRTHPNLLIGIGSHKSGSTFLHHVLSMHPQIVPAKEKELFTFRKPGFQPSNESYDEYLDNWKEWLGKKNHPDGAVLMEFTPTYITVRLISIATRYETKLVPTPSGQTLTYLTHKRAIVSNTSALFLHYPQ